MINANYDFSQTSLSGKTKSHKIYEIDGLKVGVFGLGIELDGLVSKKLYQDTVYHDPVEVAREQVEILRNQQKCDLVICLSHLGFEYSSDKISDKKLASLTSGIDLILGGHTHTFLDKPINVKNTDNQNVMINQVGWAGINLGKIDFYLKKDRLEKASASLIRIN
jgi:5'-nucleotidase